jgi:hypothetical protein
MKFLATVVILLASTFSIAQQNPQVTTPAPTSASPSLTSKEIDQQIQTLVATRQVYYERLDKITEFQKYIETERQIQQLHQQQQELNQAAAEHQKAEEKKGETKK